MDIYSSEPLERVSDNSPDSLYAQIVDRIRQWIRDGQLKEGDQLPSERELAQMFDVSRVPVREALKILEFLGAVQHIRGKGVFVKKINISNVLNNIEFMMIDPIHTLSDLFEAREAIEFQATMLAAQRRTDEDLRAMEAAVDEMEQKIKEGKDVVDASAQFHNAVIAASHNVILMSINESLGNLLKFSRQKSLKDASRWHTSLGYHKEIMQKIKEKDGEGAHRLVREHLANAKEYIVKTAR